MIIVADQEKETDRKYKWPNSNHTRNGTKRMV